MRIAAVLLVVVAAGGGSAALATGDAPQPEISPPVVDPVPASVSVAYVSTGLNFPDALGGGPVAALHDGPVLLVKTDSIPAATATELTRLAPEKIVILGGTGVISTGVEAALAAYTAGTVERLAGADRYETAAAISEANFPVPRVTTHDVRSYVFPNGITEIAATCSSFPGLAITLDTPVTGTVVLNANVQVDMNHVTGTSTYIELGFGEAVDDCSFVVLGYDGSLLIDAAVPTGPVLDTIPLAKSLDIEAGTHTFYVNAVEIGGDGVSDFRFGTMNLTFYPDP
jgi:hypothetical protein